jgi:ankyrin repeat protein
MPNHRTLTRLLGVLILLLLLAAVVVRWRRQELLVHAAVRGDVSILKGLVAIGADPNSPEAGSLPLCAAVWHGRAEAAESLITLGADVSGVDSSGFTPLIVAVSRGDDALVRLLLRHGADVDHRGSCGTAADVARANGHPGTAAILSSPSVTGPIQLAR